MKALDEASREHEEFRLSSTRRRPSSSRPSTRSSDMAAAPAQDPRQGVHEREVQHRRRRRRVLRSLREGRERRPVDRRRRSDSSDTCRASVQSAMRPDDEAVLGLVEKLLVNDPAPRKRGLAGSSPRHDESRASHGARRKPRELGSTSSARSQTSRRPGRQLRRPPRPRWRRRTPARRTRDTAPERRRWRAAATTSFARLLEQAAELGDQGRGAQRRGARRSSAAPSSR